MKNNALIPVPKRKLVATAVFVALAVVSVFALAQKAGALTINANTVFNSSLSITGALSKGSGTFVIDHPLRPFTELLYHSFVESPQALNMYQGEAVLDTVGEATIMLPDYFEALNTDFEYFLEPIGASMPNLYVKSPVRSNSFVVTGGVPRGHISWHISGVRHDPFILANPIIPEVLKTDTTPVKKGQCLYAPLCQ